SYTLLPRYPRRCSSLHPPLSLSFFFFNDTATTQIYTLSLHDALPISRCPSPVLRARRYRRCPRSPHGPRRAPPGCRTGPRRRGRSEEHTSELQSLTNLVCRLLLEKKKKTQTTHHRPHHHTTTAHDYNI